MCGHLVHATDVSNASRTLMMDLNTTQWDENVLLKEMNIPRCMLPDIRPSSEVLGLVKKEGAKLTGLYLCNSSILYSASGVCCDARVVV